MSKGDRTKKPRSRNLSPSDRIMAEAAATKVETSPAKGENCLANDVKEGMSRQMPFAQWQNLYIHLVWIYEGEPQIKSGHNIARTSFTLWCLRHGEVSLRFKDAQNLYVTQGDWVLMPPKLEEDERNFSADAKILSLYFDVQWVTGGDWLNLETPLILTSAQAQGWYRAALPMLKIVQRHFPDSYHNLPDSDATFLQYTQLQGHFLVWFSAVVNRMAQLGVDAKPLLFEDERALRIRKYLDTFPLSHPLRLEELAKTFDLSVSQLGRIYCAHFGHKPRDYFEDRRLRYACTLLRDGNESMKEIAYLLGFRHASQFSPWFRTKAKQSPSQYRNTKKEKP